MNKENLSDLRRQAQKITVTGKPAKMVWSELSNWASNKGPLAMKSAVIEFVNAYRGSSEISVLMPELMRSHIFSPYEQKALIELAGPNPGLSEFRPEITLRPKPLMPVTTSKPELALSLNPKTGSSLLRSEFTNDPRESIFLLKERTQISFNRPKMTEGRPQKFDMPTLQSHSMVFDSKASHGEVLIRNLVEHMKSHSADLPRFKAKTGHVVKRFKAKKTRPKTTKVAVKLKVKNTKQTKKSKLSSKTQHKTTKLRKKQKTSKKSRRR
ncbi:MAG: hypothetical protein ABID61_00515 [Candidatus Micrarchaeota archaeon]